MCMELHLQIHSEVRWNLFIAETAIQQIFTHTVTYESRQVAIAPDGRQNEMKY
jgi:hypothetical protein